MNKTDCRNETNQSQESAEKMRIDHSNNNNN